MEVKVLLGLRPRPNRLMQPEASSVVPPESRAAQFALQLLNDLVASGDARSPVWNAQVDLLAEFVQKCARLTGDDQLDDFHRNLKDARIPRPPRPLPDSLFVPMS